MLKWLRAVIMVYVSTGIKHQKCVLFRKRNRPALVLSSEEQAKFPIQPARAAHNPSELLPWSGNK